MADQEYPNLKEFDRVCVQLKAGGAMSYEDLGAIFGPNFWVMLVYSLMDAADAARAIAGAIGRLKAEAAGQQAEVPGASA